MVNLPYGSRVWELSKDPPKIYVVGSIALKKSGFFTTVMLRARVVKNISLMSSSILLLFYS